MKKETRFVLFSGFGLIALVVALYIGVQAIGKRANLPLTVYVTSEKESYLLGEAINLQFELVNEGDAVLALLTRPDVSNGYLEIWIAGNGQEFNRYSNSKWGLFEGVGVSIQPGESVRSEATIIGNSKPVTSHLNAEAEKRLTKGRITTDYVFPNAGVYYIKAVVSIRQQDASESVTRIESKPIRVTFTEPVGDDLKVWEQIKDNGKIAYFLQHGDTPTIRNEEAERLVDEVQQIVQEFPNSYLGGQIKQRLEKFRSDEAQRKDKLEKARTKTN